jgi:hypothetical protein
VTNARERRLEMTIEHMAAIVRGCMDDLDKMKHFHAPSKRGANYTRHLESLESRLVCVEQGLSEALK